MMLLDPVIIFIVGLPGSGKSTLARELAAHDTLIIDDISVDTEEKIKLSVSDMIITDPNACAVSPDTVRARLEEWFGKRTIVFMAFENDPDACWVNLEGRDDRKISRATVDALSQVYRPKDWDAFPRRVWRPS